MKASTIMGSTSDLAKVEPAIELLKSFDVNVSVRCLSAHRAAAQLSAYIKEINEDGTEVVITAAGMAAALPGVVASQTVLPVIGVPCKGGALNGVDALYATVQMPTGIPVATVAINGAANAALLCIEMLALSDDELADKLAARRAADHAKVLEKNARIEAEFNR